MLERNLPRGHRARIALALVIVFAGASALTAGALSARPARVLGVGGRALGRSVAFKAGGISILGGDVCERAGVEWRCYAAGDGSSSAEYRVHADERGCWTARLRQRGPRRSPPRASGCISILDYARPVQRFLGVAGD